MHGARLHKRLDETQWPKTQDETYWAETETYCSETETRPRRLDLDHIPGKRSCSKVSLFLVYLY